MAYTDQDEKSIIERQKNEIASLTGKLNTLYNESAVRERALSHLRGAIDESISMASRIASMPVAAGDKVAQKRRVESQMLRSYFQDAKRDFETVLSGFPVEKVAEKPNVENISVDAGEGQVSPSPEQEQ